MAVGGLADQQQAALGVEHRAAHADLGRRVADLLGEQRLDPRVIGRRVRGHDARAESPQRLRSVPCRRDPG